jgi:Cu+-exporting ATPase
MAESDLSMAMGTGTDTAIATADITLMKASLKSALAALALSKKTLRIIRGNLFWALIYNVILIPIAAAGLLNPMLASAAMAASSLFVVFNSLRLSRDTNLPA